MLWSSCGVSRKAQKCDTFLISSVFENTSGWMLLCLMPNLCTCIFTYSHPCRLFERWRRRDQRRPAASHWLFAWLCLLKISDRRKQSSITPQFPSASLSCGLCVCYYANTLRFLLINCRRVATSRWFLCFQAACWCECCCKGADDEAHSCLWACPV